MPTRRETLMTALREAFRRAESLPEGSTDQENVLAAAEELVSDYVCEQRDEAVGYERMFNA